MMKPYYQDEYATIYHGDCRELMSTLKMVDLVLTDPPYGVNKAEWDQEFPLEWMIPASRICRAMGIMPGIWNILKLPETIGDLKYKGMIAAHLVNGMTRGPIGFANFIPCIVYVREGFSVHSQQSDIKDVAIGIHRKSDHPCPKPLGVMQWFLSRLLGETILDPFMGSGTTLRAAKDLERKSIGIEIEERYCEVAARRLAQGVLPLVAGMSQMKQDETE